MEQARERQMVREVKIRNRRLIYYSRSLSFLEDTVGEMGFFLRAKQGTDRFQAGKNHDLIQIWDMLLR